MNTIFYARVYNNTGKEIRTYFPGLQKDLIGLNEYDNLKNKKYSRVYPITDEFASICIRNKTQHELVTRHDKTTYMIFTIVEN